MKKLIIILIMLVSIQAFSQPFAPKARTEHRTKKFKKRDATSHLKFAPQKRHYKSKKFKRHGK